MKFTVIILTLYFHGLWATDYCSPNLMCDKVPNSGCNCDYGSNCMSPQIKITDEMRKSILDAHNKYREIVASGNETRGGIRGGVIEMFALQYDKELEYTANCYNKKCSTGHDKCRKTHSFQSVGQNIWGISRGCVWEHDFESAAYGWYKEVEKMTPSCLNSFVNGCDNWKDVGHFTQMVWAKTTHVGCSMVERNPKECQVICNYGPAGNVKGAPVFLRGSPASKCKYKSKRFEHLCLLTEDQESATARNVNQFIVCLASIFLSLINLW